VYLAIDTSTTIASLAILQEDEILAEMTWRCGLNHTIEMYPCLDFLIRRAGRDIKDTECVFVALGPGSFNGLRVGVSAAKGLAYSLGCPIIGLSTLEVSAYQLAETGMQICAVQNAGREEIAVAIYKRSPRKWSKITPEHLTKVADLPAEIKEKTIFCGEMTPATIIQIKKTLKTQALIASPAARLRRAAYLADLGKLRRLKSDYNNLATLQPIYLRRPPITDRKVI
jgi:tRNA threonylcarbamoyladenosine biosynthesis protein TsaB